MRLWHVTHEYTSGYASKSVATEITLFFGKIQYQLMLLFHCKKKKKEKKNKRKKKQKKRSFPLNISLVNVTKSGDFFGFGHIY